MKSDPNGRNEGPSRRTALRNLGLMGAAWALLGMDGTGARERKAETEPVAPTSAQPWGVNFDLGRWFDQPIRLAGIEVRQAGPEEYVVMVRDSEGRLGVVPGNNRLPYGLAMLRDLIAPGLVGQDARQLEALVDRVYRNERNYKFVGMPFWNAVGHVELAVLDLLGRAAGRRVCELFGAVLHEQLPVYLTTFERDNQPEAALASVAEQLQRSGIAAVKLKVGGRMANNSEPVTGRTEGLIARARAVLGDRVTLYADANGSFDAKEGLRVGRMLEAEGFAMYEEPCPWEEYEANRQVCRALRRIAVAGGEQDTSLARYRWLVAEHGLDILQPDIMYVGGFVRTLRIAELAHRVGRTVSVHSPRTGALEAFKLHFAALVSNAGAYQEYNPAVEVWAGRIDLPQQVVAGSLALPQGDGWGYRYDPAWLQTLPVISRV